MTDARLLLIILALPFLGSLGAAFLPTRGRNRAALLAGAVALAGLVLTVGFYPVLAHGETMRLVIPWLPSLGLALTLRLNGFSWLFSVLILGIGGLVVLYARYYMSRSEEHTSELQSIMRISYAVFCLKKKIIHIYNF